MGYYCDVGYYCVARVVVLVLLYYCAACYCAFILFCIILVALTYTRDYHFWPCHLLRFIIAGTAPMQRLNVVARISSAVCQGPILSNFSKAKGQATSCIL